MEDELKQEPEKQDNGDLNGYSEYQGDIVPELQKTVQLSGMFEKWFLDYASYVILERAVPDIYDGLKPVQRRLLHSMKDLDDGRFNKVANVIGHTMKYHPHGDASIGEALVQLGQKELLIETQGNWGNILTGDGPAAPRYIEARLSKFALEVVFDPKTTEWKPSYDGRNREPVCLPVKFPLLLAQGAEGIAVGLASKILPHNFNELIDASIDQLNGITTPVYPDFPTGGLADCTKYADGARGGRVRVRARITQIDKKTLAITEIPFGTNTLSLIESILSSNDRGKIKIKKIDDNTAENVEILIHLAPGISPDTTIDALYAFTDCEISLSTNACVVKNGHPLFINVNEILNFVTENTRQLLGRELEIKRAELLEQWHTSSLEKIFIEKKIYRKIEECLTWESVLETIDTGLKPFVKKLKREVTLDDILRLTEIKIKRISKYDSFKADELIGQIAKDIEKVENNLAHLTEYAIEYLQTIKKKYGVGRERKTEIRNFESIEATAVAVANQKLYVNRSEGFAGTALKKDEYVCDCSDIDDLIHIHEDGTMAVSKVGEKVFLGKNIIHIAVFKRNDDRTIYNAVYQDGRKGHVMVKRFAFIGATRGKEYNITKGSGDSRVIYLSANPNGEAEVIQVFHKPKPKLKKLSFEFDFSQLPIRNRNSIGIILTRNPVRRIIKKEEGISTLKAREIWFDDTVKRLNAEGRGILLGAFEGDDKILCIYPSGQYRTTNYDLSNHFPEDMAVIEKYEPGHVLTALYLDGELGKYYVKRFIAEPSEKPVDFIGEGSGASLVMVWTHQHPLLEYSYVKKNKSGDKITQVIDLTEFIGVKSIKAKGKRLSDHDLFELEKRFIDLPVPEPQEGDEPADDPRLAGTSESGMEKIEKDEHDLNEKHDKGDGPEAPGLQMTLDF